MIAYNFFCYGMETLSYVWKIHHKNERFLCLVAHIVTKLSQKVCLIITHILIFWHVRCDYNLWNAYWFYCIFRVFSYIFDDHHHSCLICYISTKISLIVYLINTHILIFWHVRYFYKLRKVFWFNWFFGNFNVWYVILHQPFTNFCEKLMKIISTCHLVICNWM